MKNEQLQNNENNFIEIKSESRHLLSQRKKWGFIGDAVKAVGKGISHVAKKVHHHVADAQKLLEINTK